MSAPVPYTDQDETVVEILLPDGTWQEVSSWISDDRTTRAIAELHRLARLTIETYRVRQISTVAIVDNGTFRSIHPQTRKEDLT